MKRRTIVASMAMATLPGISAALPPKALLTVSESMGRTNNDATNSSDLTESDFVKLTSRAS